MNTSGLNPYRALPILRLYPCPQNPRGLPQLVSTVCTESIFQRSKWTALANKLSPRLYIWHQGSKWMVPCWRFIKLISTVLQGSKHEQSNTALFDLLLSVDHLEGYTGIELEVIWIQPINFTALNGALICKHCRGTSLDDHELIWSLDSGGVWAPTFIIGVRLSRWFVDRCDSIHRN